ncbi:hypothetical protein TIFTF001_002999 [Ficus carica]|uniref:Uncharacterized protein n=1 Tax=Ficus carica TaxID=3494 RepID=A0AA88CQK0_FICCA|nr:hypothetical protein TIFTF001_002999 [Ficus carica]
MSRLLIPISAPTTTYVTHHYPSHLISDPSGADHTPFTDGLIGVRALPSFRSSPASRPEYQTSPIASASQKQRARSASCTRMSQLADQNTRRAPSHQCIPEAECPRSPCPTCHTLPDTSPVNGRLRLPTPAARHIATRRHLPWQGLSLLTPTAVALAPPRPVAWRHGRPTRVQVQSHVTHLGYSVADPAGSPRAPEPAKGPYKYRRNPQI